MYSRKCVHTYATLHFSLPMSGYVPSLLQDLQASQVEGAPSSANKETQQVRMYVRVYLLMYVHICIRIYICVCAYS